MHLLTTAVVCKGTQRLLWADRTMFNMEKMPIHFGRLRRGREMENRVVNCQSRAVYKIVERLPRDSFSIS
jgi:hypothetical protein